MSGFRDRVALVTGASSGIGLALARRLAGRGARVALAARRADLLQREAAGRPEMLAVAADVTDPASLDRLVAQVLERWGRIDILVNNAGILVHKPLLETPEAEARRAMEVNFFGAVAMTRAVLPAMRRQGSGTIVNVASVSGKLGLPYLGYYCASKFALVGWSQALRQELAPKGIRVATVCPGLVRTEMVEDTILLARAKSRRIRMLPVEEAADAIARAIETGAPETILPWTSRLMVWAHRMFPSIFEAAAWKLRLDGPEYRRP